MSRRAAVPAAVGVALLLACHHKPPDLAVPTVYERTQEGRRVVFIGLDGVDWRLLDRLAADGTMPRLAMLARNGDRRTLLTQHPPLSPLLWTTMMTGVSPLEHRILDFTRFDPVSRERVPITSDERAVPAIWNMATYGGKKVGVFGMWATEPSETVNGVIVSNAPIASPAKEATQRVNEETESVRRAAIQWLHDGKPDLTIVYFQGTDEIAHLTRGDVDAARPYYRRIDEIVGELAQRAKAIDADVIIASDHGFDWGGNHESSTAIATAGKWHLDEGMLLHWPNAGGRRPPLQTARIDQVCATLLAVLGLPHDDRLAPPIAGVVRASAERVNYHRYFHRHEQRTTNNEQRNHEAIANLKALGYIGGSEPARAPANATSTRTPASFNNEGLILGEKGRLDEAEAAFVGALTIDPNYESAKTNLADLLSARARKSGGPPAVTLLTRAIALRNSDDAHLLRGRYRLEQRDCAGALQDFTAIRAESAIQWTSIAAARGCLGNSAGARAALRRSLELDPNQPEVRAMLHE